MDESKHRSTNNNTNDNSNVHNKCAVNNRSTVKRRKQIMKKRNITKHAINFSIDLEQGATIIPIYQRQFIWSLLTQQGFLTSIYYDEYIPPVIISMVNERPDEPILSDGGQRGRTLNKLFNNKIKLPVSIGAENGGGKFFKDAPQETQDKYKYYILDVVELYDLTERDAQKVFLNLQKGVPLTNGEIIHANYGNHWEVVNNIAETHPITPKISSNRNAEYRIITGLLLQELNITDHVDKLQELQFIEEGYFTNVVTKQNLKNLNKFLDYAYGMSKYHKFTLSYGRLLVLQGLFKKVPRLYDYSKKQLAEFYRTYMNNQKVIKENLHLNLTDKLIVEYANSQTKKYSNGKNVKIALNHMVSECKKWLNGEMVEITEDMLTKLHKED